MLYVALFRMSFRRQMAYRAATLAGLVTNFFFGVLRAFIFIALYTGADAVEVAGYSLPQAVTFSALTQALIGPLMMFGSWEVMRTIRSGDIAGDLAKPLDFYGFWLAQDLGRAAYQVLGRGVPIMLAYPLLFDLVWPASLATWALFALSVVLSVLISFSWRFLVNVTALWTVDAYGLGRVAYMSVLLLSGFIVPLTFYPDWLRAIVRLTPFPAMVTAPIEIYLGMPSGLSVAYMLLTQAFWVVVLAFVARRVYALGVARLVVQGG
jgi:ABC-2 type transport system permease protein